VLNTAELPAPGPYLAGKTARTASTTRGPDSSRVNRPTKSFAGVVTRCSRSGMPDDRHRPTCPSRSTSPGEFLRRGVVRRPGPLTWQHDRQKRRGLFKRPAGRCYIEGNPDRGSVFFFFFWARTHRKAVKSCNQMIVVSGAEKAPRGREQPGAHPVRPGSSLGPATDCCWGRVRAVQRARSFVQLYGHTPGARQKPRAKRPSTDRRTRPALRHGTGHARAGGVTPATWCLFVWWRVSP